MSNLKEKLLYRQQFKTRALGQISWHCFDYKNSRIVPKRNLEWFKTKEPLIYFELKEKFPSRSLNEIYWLLNNNILQESDIPLCQVCKKSKCILVRKHLRDYCCNRCAIKQEHVQNKTKLTCLERYNKIRYFGEKKIYQFGEHPQQLRYKNLHKIKDKSFMIQMQSKPWIEIAEYFGLCTNTHTSQYNFMKKVGYPIKTKEKSILEYQLFLYVSNNYNKDIIRNTKNIIQPYELDIYIPELKLALEFNGDYYHQVNYEKKDKEYHLIKTNLAESKGIRLIHIWEHEWLNNQAYVKEVILSYLNGKIPDTQIYTRKIPRDYFSTLDFLGNQVEEPIIETFDRYDICKTGYILL